MNAVTEGANTLRETVESTLAGIVVHEVGHDAKGGHPNDPANYKEWSVESFTPENKNKNYISNQGGNPAKSKDSPENKDLKPDFKTKFIADKPKDNYQKNKDSKGNPPPKIK
jgi:hypothetical protein